MKKTRFRETPEVKTFHADCALDDQSPGDKPGSISASESADRVKTEGAASTGQPGPSPTSTPSAKRPKPPPPTLSAQPTRPLAEAVKRETPSEDSEGVDSMPTSSSSVQLSQTRPSGRPPPPPPMMGFPLELCPPVPAVQWTGATLRLVQCAASLQTGLPIVTVEATLLSGDRIFFETIVPHAWRVIAGTQP